MTAAIRTHFKTKKRQKKVKQANKEKQVLKEQRIRSRKNAVSIECKKVRCYSQAVTVKPGQVYPQDCL